LAAYAILEPDTLASTAVHETSGEFTFAFLPADTYTVTIADSEDKELHSESDVAVTVGSTTTLEITIIYESEE